MGIDCSEIPKANAELSWTDLFPKIWNKLPDAIGNATTLKEPKKILKSTCSSRHKIVNSRIIVNDSIRNLNCKSLSNSLCKVLLIMYQHWGKLYIKVYIT